MPLASIADLNTADAPQMVEIAKKLSSMYDEFLDTFKEGHERAAGIHASDLNSCIRRAFYCLTAVERREVISRHWRKRFETGHAVHDMVQKHFRKMSIRENAKRFADTMAYQNGWHVSFDPEVRVAPNLQPLAAHYYFHSSCDGVFTFRETEDAPPFLRVGLEIKTESPDGYSDLRSPKGYHVEQAHLYMAVLDLPLMWFFYFNKGNQNNTESNAPWLVTFNPTVWQRVESRARAAIEGAVAGTPPAKEEGAHCEFCPWSWTCEPERLKREANPRAYNSLMRRPGA